MANHASAAKAHRRSVKLAAFNRRIVSDLRTYIKKFEAALLEKNVDSAATLLREVQVKLFKAANKNIVKLNTASRKFSRLTKKFKALSV